MMADKQPVISIDEYIGGFPEDVQVILERVRQAIRAAAPEATEIISYGIPTFDLNGKHLVFFAGWKRHVAVYPLPAGDAAFQQKIAPYRHEQQAKSAIHLPLAEPIPYDLVTELVTFLKREKSEKSEKP